MNLTIMSLNLRYDKPDPGVQNWQVRRDSITSLIEYYQPDVIGTQEGLGHQLLDLHRRLPNYHSIGDDRSGKGNNEYCAIFYHSQRLNCLETDNFFLSDTPDIPGSISVAWGNPLPRMATWGRLEIINSLHQILILNTHLDYHSAKVLKTLLGRMGI